MQQQPVPTKSVASNVIRGSLGNLIEWYDWYAYAAFSVYFASVFFPSGNQTAQLLNTAGIFAVGFLVRPPLGGWVFGRYADRFGRRAALTLSVLLMGAGSLGGIAVLPGYAQIGTLSPILLVVLRLLQGLSLGGEYGTSQRISAKSPPPPPARLLLVVSIRDAHQRATVGARRPDHPAAVAHLGPVACVGMADRFRHRGPPPR